MFSMPDRYSLDTIKWFVFENSNIAAMFLIKEYVIVFDSSWIHHLLSVESDLKSFTVRCYVSNKNAILS